MRPGVFRHVTPWRRASPERGRTKPANPGGIATREPGGNERAPAGRRERDVLAGVEIEAGVVGVLLTWERQLRVEPHDVDLQRATP